MKKLTIALVFLALILVVGCQVPQDIKSQLDKQTQTIETLQKTVTEQGATIQQLKMDLDKIMTDYYKGKTPATTKTTTPQPPTRVGR
jgi:uncharacterized coiled-coil protein SlyX